MLHLHCCFIIIREDRNDVCPPKRIHTRDIVVIGNHQCEPIRCTSFAMNVNYVTT